MDVNINVVTINGPPCRFYFTFIFVAGYRKASVNSSKSFWESAKCVLFLHRLFNSLKDEKLMWFQILIMRNNILFSKFFLGGRKLLIPTFELVGNQFFFQIEIERLVYISLGLIFLIPNSLSLAPSFM